MRIRFVLPALLTALAIGPQVAAAQDAPPPVPATPPATTTPPAATPPPATPPPAVTPAPVPKAQLTLSAAVSRGVLAGERWVLRGTLRPYVAGERVTIRLYRHGRKLAVRAVRVQPRGRFTLGFTASGSGRLTVRASHRASATLGTAVARPLHVQVLALHAGPGSRGRAVRVLQQRLSALGYVVGQRGLYDARTARAVLTFRKLTGMARTTLASADVFGRIARGQGAFKVRFPRHGRHVEADLTHQVLALIGGGGHVERLYPLSSGKPSTPTILGSFRVYSKTPGTNSHGMIFSSYFHGGYAIHGYVEVPVYAASHGCLRVPPPDAVSIYDWVRYGTPVDVYYR